MTVCAEERTRSAGNFDLSIRQFFKRQISHANRSTVSKSPGTKCSPTRLPNHQSPSPARRWNHLAKLPGNAPGKIIRIRESCFIGNIVNLEVSRFQHIKSCEKPDLPDKSRSGLACQRFKFFMKLSPAEKNCPAKMIHAELNHRVHSFDIDFLCSIAGICNY